MHALIRRLVAFAAFFALAQFSIGQDHQAKIMYYKPPPDINGLTPVKVTVKYKVVNLFGSITLLAEATCQGELRYQYKGREFTFTGLDEAVRKVVCQNPTIRVLVEGPGEFKREMNVMIISGMDGSVFGNSYLIKEAKTKEEKSPAAYTVTPLQVVSVSYDKGWEVQQQLEEKIRNEQKAAQVKSFIEAGDRALQQQNLADAEIYYTKAAQLDKTNSYVAGQMEKIKQEKTRVSARKLYDDLMAAAKAAETSGDLDNANKLYEKAEATGVNSYAGTEARRVAALQQRKRKDLEDKIAKLKEEEDKKQAKQQEQNEKADAETKRLLQEKEAYNKMIAQQKADSVAASLAETERKKALEAQRKRMDEENIRERQRQAEEKAKDKQEADGRRQADANFMKRFERDMAYNPEIYYSMLLEANQQLDKAQSINPFAELQLKREWWDNNSYIQMFADELYEDQRRQNHANYLKKKSEQQGEVYRAKQTFMDAVRYVDAGSAQHKYLLSKIEHCNKLIDFHQVSWKMDFRLEEKRKQYREQARTMAAVNTAVNDHNKAMLAYDLISTDAASKADNLVKKYELAQRFDKAELQYTRDMAIAGATTSIAMSAIIDDSKTLEVIERGSQVNAFTSIGFSYLPILLNETSDFNTPETNIGNMSVATTNAGLDIWLYKAPGVEIGIGGHGGIGLLPMKGITQFYYNYGGRLNFNFGVRRFKITTSAEYIARSGTQEVDYDVYNASNTNTLTASNRIGKGSFNYSLLRFGGGIKIDLGDEYEASHILLRGYAEKPSFYPESIFNKPIFSYMGEWMFQSGAFLNISYANKYVIAGEKKYRLTEVKNGDYLHFQFGKYWTL